MNEHDLRSLVREAVERHLGRPQSATKDAPRARLESRLETSHASHIILNVLPGSDVDDGLCVIEPSVRCNHCGFCQSYGH